MIPNHYIKHPYTEACKEAGHRTSSGMTCCTCRQNAGTESRRARGKYPPLQHPYTEACKEAGHAPVKGGRACATCRAKTNFHRLAQAAGSNGNGHKPQPVTQPQWKNLGTLGDAGDAVAVAPSSPQPSATTESWELWATQMIDAFILQSHYVPASADPFRPGFVQDLISRRPRP